MESGDEFCNEVLAPLSKGAGGDSRLRDSLALLNVRQNIGSLLRELSPQVTEGCIPPPQAARQIIISSATQKINIDFTATKV